MSSTLGAMTRWLVIGTALLACGCFDKPPYRGAPPAVVQTTSTIDTPDGAGAVRLALPQTTEPGDLLVVATSLFGSDTVVDGSVMAITDDAGDTYQPATLRPYSCDQSTVGAIWFAAGVSADASAITITQNKPTNGMREVWVLELSGLRLTSVNDVAKTLNDQTQGATSAAPVVMPTSFPSVIISEINAGGDVAGLAGGGFTALPIVNGDDAAYEIATVPASAGYGAAWTTPTSGIYCAATAAFAGGP